MAKATRGFPPAETSSESRQAPGLMERLKYRWHLVVTFLVIVVGSVVVWAMTAFSGLQVVEIPYEVVAEYPHDSSAFTQGLLYHQGYLYESTGQYGESTVRKVEIKSGQVLASTPLRDQYFGEGLTMVGDQFFQLTWKSGTGFVYNSELIPVKQFEYSGEGWGLAYDGQHLIMSDKSATLRFHDPETMRLDGNLPVKYGQSAVPEVNEMEYVNGQIYANVWKRDYIYRIDPQSGQVTGRINLGNLLPIQLRPDASQDGSLNGIAYNPESDTFYVTGKHWPKLYEIRLK